MIAHAGTAATQSTTVREFLQIISDQARAATEGLNPPGVLQMSRLHPMSENLVPTRFTIGDVEPMTKLAVTDSNAGHNVYIEGRTVREDLRGPARGKLEDTAAVFAIVIDSDADKKMGWIPTVPPSLTVETSPGNFQFWYFLRKAIGWAAAQKIGERMRAATKTDNDTGNPTQPYRIAGTVNYPSKSKIERGRFTVPTRLMEFDPEQLPELEAAFPPPEGNDTAGATQGNGQAAGDPARIPDETMRVIRDGAPKPERSDVFWNVMLALKDLGFTIDGITALLEQYPDGIAAKYRGRLRREVERVYNKIEDAPKPEPATPVFDPWAQYVVPDFPLHTLPRVVQDYVTAQSIIVGGDISAMAMAVLTAFSGALDHRFAVKMMRHGNWWEHPRMWTLLVGDPSRKKTPIIDVVTAPLEEHQKVLRTIYEAALFEYEQAKKAAKEADKTFDEDKPEPPPRYVMWDVTVEKLGEVLARTNGEHGLLVKRDEFSGWIGAMEKYASSTRSISADRGFWLKAFDGGPYSMDRISRGETYIRNLSVSLIGGIQPARLAELHGLTSDGLLQRFVPVMMGPSKLAQDRGSDEEHYLRLFSKLIAARPQRLILSDAALQQMNLLREYLHELEQAVGGLAEGFQGFVGKLPGIAGRLALILHMAADPDAGGGRDIEQETVKHVRDIVVDFVLPHALEFYRSSEGLTNGDRLKRLASWLITCKETKVTSRDLTRNVRCLRGLSTFDLNNAVSPLVAAGWLEPADKSPVNRNWTITPIVARQFEQQRKVEEHRKQLVAELMGSPRRPNAS